MKINVTESAIKELTRIKADNDSIYTKIIIVGQGCGIGFSLSMDKPGKDDFVESYEGINVAVDKRFVDMYDEFFVDFRQATFSSGFTVEPGGDGLSCF